MFSGWLLVAEKKECGGAEIYKDNLESVEDCAAKCMGTASMFIFGTNDFGKIRCGTAQEVGNSKGKKDGCSCFCETTATTNGICPQIDSIGYRLYKYASQGNHYFVLLLLLLLLLLVKILFYS